MIRDQLLASRMVESRTHARRIARGVTADCGILIITSTIVARGRYNNLSGGTTIPPP